MARLSNHEITETYGTKLDPNYRYHVTRNDRVVRTTGPRGGNAKILFVCSRKLGGNSAPVDAADAMFNFSGLGRRATATEFRHRLDMMERMSL